MQNFRHPTIDDDSIEAVENFDNKKLMEYYHSCDRYLDKTSVKEFREDITTAMNLLDFLRDTIGYMEQKAKKTKGRYIKDSNKLIWNSRDAGFKPR